MSQKLKSEVVYRCKSNSNSATIILSGSGNAELYASNKTVYKNAKSSTSTIERLELIVPEFSEMVPTGDKLKAPGVYRLESTVDFLSAKFGDSVEVWVNGLVDTNETIIVDENTEE